LWRGLALLLMRVIAEHLASVGSEHSGTFPPAQCQDGLLHRQCPGQPVESRRDDPVSVRWPTDLLYRVGQARPVDGIGRTRHPGVDVLGDDPVTVCLGPLADGFRWTSSPNPSSWVVLEIRRYATSRMRTP